MTRASSSRRRAVRLAVVTAPLVALSLVPAVASAAPAGDAPGRDHPLGVANSLLIFLVAPVGAFLLIALLTLRPGSAPKAQRYRPGRDWSAAPAWSGVKPEGAAARALSAGTPHVPVMDGAPEQAHADTLADSLAERAPTDEGARPDLPPTGPVGGDPGRSGGSSGSW